MNSRTQTYELSVEGRQVEEAVSSLFHTVLLYRTLGKFFLQDDNGSYTVGAVGFHDVDCDFIELTYVCSSSQHLDCMIRKEISKFSENLRRDHNGCGQITLEFFSRRRSHWLFTTENVPWEVWNVRIELVQTYNDELRETVGLSLADKIGDIAEIVNRDEYLPTVPAPTDLALIFNTDLPDVQPYWFNVNSMTADHHTPSLGKTVKKVLKPILFS